jgi:hypothetical protein
VAEGLLQILAHRMRLIRLDDVPGTGDQAPG